MLNTFSRTTCARNFSSVHNASSLFYDVVIIGGGLVGSAMACSVGRSPSLSSKKVLLVDSSNPQAEGMEKREGRTQSFSNRVSSISPSSVQLFEKLDVWRRIASNAQPVSALYIEDGCSDSKIMYEQLNLRSPISHIIENNRVVQALHECLRDGSNVDWRHSTFQELSLPEHLGENVIFKLDTGEIVECSLLIAADGANSKLRKISGLASTSEDYQQSCIVGTLEVEQSENNLENTIAWQRFMPLGPIGILPLTEKLSSLAWTTSTSEAKRLLELSNEQFVDELNGALFDRSGHSQLLLGPLSCVSTLLDAAPFLRGSRKLNFPSVLGLPNNDRASFPLSLVHACDYVGHRVALIGDAAHRVHPMAGLGVNLGWSDVVNLTNALEDAVSEGGDLGSLNYLKRFDDKSQRRNVSIMTAIDCLNSLYSTNFPPFVFLRSIGVNLLDRILPAKDLIVHYAS